MPRKAPAKGIKAAGFALTDQLRSELSFKFPRIDLDKTFEIFYDKALAQGWLYSHWPAAFRNYLRNAQQYGGVEYKPGLHDPKFDHLIERARAVGFRMPRGIDSVGTYRQELDEFDKRQAKQSPLKLGDIIKRIPKQ